MVFSFNFSPIVSSFVVSKREEYEKDFGRDFTERKCSQIISRASMLMVAVVMFFAFSCLFTLSPANMAEAKAQNIPVLSYLANHFASMTRYQNNVRDYTGICGFHHRTRGYLQIFLRSLSGNAGRSQWPGPEVWL